MSEGTDTFDALTMDGGPFDSLRVERTDDGGVKLSISRDAVVFAQEASGTMCAEDARELAKWLTPDVHEQLDALIRENAGLRYYIAQLERNVTQEEREYAAGIARLQLSAQEAQP